MPDKAIILYCRTCGAELTNSLIPITSADAMVSLCTFAEGEAVTPRGQVLLLDEDVQLKGKNMRRETIPSGVAWVHLGDLVDAVGLTPFTKRLAGCCDISGIDGPNRICACGAHVGTQFSDCYEYHTFQPDPKATKWVLAKTNEKQQ